MYYWLGMILTTVLGKKKYSYEYMVHLSMVLKLSSQPPIEKYQFLSANGKTTYKSPDLIAMNNLGGYYGVFESKGCSEYKKETMEKGFVQAKSIEKINKIVIGKTAGFCYGVKRAVDGATNEIKNSKEPVYCLGEIVHNKQVVEELKKQGKQVIF